MKYLKKLWPYYLSQGIFLCYNLYVLFGVYINLFIWKIRPEYSIKMFQGVFTYYYGLEFYKQHFEYTLFVAVILLLSLYNIGLKVYMMVKNKKLSRELNIAVKKRGEGVLHTTGCKISKPRLVNEIIIAIVIILSIILVASYKRGMYVQVEMMSMFIWVAFPAMIGLVRYDRRQRAYKKAFDTVLAPIAPTPEVNAEIENTENT